MLAFFLAHSVGILAPLAPQNAHTLKPPVQPARPQAAACSLCQA